MIETISTQESSIRFNQFNAKVAWDLGSKIRSLFAERYPDGQSKGLGLVVRVELFNGLRLLECVVGDGPVTAPANLYVTLQLSGEEVADDRYWVQGKSNTVKRFSKSSLRVGREYVHPQYCVKC